MSNRPLEEFDSTPLVNTLFEKTKAGKLVWEATADPNCFITSVGGSTALKIFLKEKPSSRSYFGNEQVPVLVSLNEKGGTELEIESPQVSSPDGLWPLYRLARRIGNKLDEKMGALIEVVQKL